MEVFEGVFYQFGDLLLNGYKKMLFKYFILKIMKNQIYINFICVCFFLLICIIYLGIGYEENVDIE